MMRQRTARFQCKRTLTESARIQSMTYRTQAGRQFVVIATGRGTDAALVASALSEQWALLSNVLYSPSQPITTNSISRLCWRTMKRLVESRMP